MVSGFWFIVAVEIMWVLTIIITCAIGLFFLFSKILVIIDDRREYKEFKEIFEAHRKLGYPELTKDQQFDILDNGNLSYVSDLTPHRNFPITLLEYYINIQPNDYLEHLHTMDLMRKIPFDPNEIRDGSFIRQIGDGLEYIYCERGSVSFRKSFGTYDQLLRYLVYSRLKIYAPKKYRKLRKNYYL
jgi:hypothetical protein